jgi:hypothetical protein
LAKAAEDHLDRGSYLFVALSDQLKIESIVASAEDIQVVAARRGKVRHLD